MPDGAPGEPVRLTLSLALSALLLVACGVRPPAGTPAGPPVVVKASELLAAYKANEVAADAAYKDKTLDVVGFVDRVGRDASGEAFVLLNGEDELRFSQVRCYPAPGWNLAAVRPGQSVAVEGVCRGKRVDVVLTDCQDVTPESHRSKNR